MQQILTKLANKIIAHFSQINKKSLLLFTPWFPNLNSGMRTGFFQKRGIPAKKEETPHTPFKMQQI